MSDEQLSEMRNFNTDLNGVELIKRNIQNHFQNYDHKTNNEFYEIAYEYLKSKNEYLGIEYRFLCWLDQVFNYDIELIKPTLVTPVVLNHSEFESKYVFRDTRRMLYDNLFNVIQVIKLNWDISNFSILIGGSFSDIDVADPNDIDCVLLVHPSCNNYDTLHENFLYASKIIPKEKRIDLKVLPLNYSTNNFKAYSNIICLGNKARVKDKMGKTKNNSFIRRDIIRLDFNFCQHTV